MIAEAARAVLMGIDAFKAELEVDFSCSGMAGASSCPRPAATIRSRWETV